MADMPKKLSANKLELKSLRSILSNRKCRQASNFPKVKENSIRVRNPNEKGKNLAKGGQKNNGTSAQATIVVVTAATISLLCILPMAIALGPSPFFPRLPYHKVKYNTMLLITSNFKNFYVVLIMLLNIFE